MDYDDEAAWESILTPKQSTAPLTNDQREVLIVKRTKSGRWKRETFELDRARHSLGTGVKSLS